MQNVLADFALQVDSAMKTALTAGTEIVGVRDQTCARHVSENLYSPIMVDNCVSVNYLGGC